MKEFNFNKYETLKSSGLRNEDIAKEMNISVRTLYNRLKENETDYSNEFAKSKVEVEKAKEKANILAKQLKAVTKELRLTKDQIEGNDKLSNNLDGRGNPDWLDYSPSKTTKSIPTLFCSDEHWGEVVRSEQINGLNEYNTVIARERYNRVINNYLKVCNEYLPNCTDTTRMVLALGGDNVGGDIHEELALTNDMTTMEAVYDYVDHKVRGIRALQSAGFKQIFVPCVRGNHDRNTHKVHTKNMLETSFAYLIYMFLMRIFEQDKGVVFSVPRSMDCFYKVNNTRMLLTHGDCFKGFGSLTGKPFYEKKKMYDNIGNGFDNMIIGHFHNYSSINNSEIIVNGTLKGFDEYAFKSGFTFQRPCQAFFLTDENGININLPIFADDKKVPQADNWVSWKK